MDGQQYCLLDLLPHRPPMLMVDRILSLDGDSCQAVKRVSADEPCFLGHFPGHPVFPGVLIIEALAQACSLCLNRGGGESLPIFAGIERARFLSMVRPGDELLLDVHRTGERKGFHTFACSARAGDRQVCRAELTIVRKDIT